jgi:hypothetical protein
MTNKIEITETNNKCIRCGNLFSQNQVQYCSQCGEIVCDECTRIPNPDYYYEGKIRDFCLTCYAKQEFANLWSITYIGMGGDNYTRIVDLPTDMDNYEVEIWAYRHLPVMDRVIGVSKLIPEFSEDEKEAIRYEVSKGFAYSMEAFGISEIIECCDNLSPLEKEWAKNNIDWKIVVNE